MKGEHDEPSSTSGGTRLAWPATLLTTCLAGRSGCGPTSM
jgi:hypothetical protein